MKTKINIILIILLIIAIVISGCKGTEEINKTKNEEENKISGTPNNESDTITIIDRAERKVEVPVKVNKIVSLMKECTSVVLTLGAADKLIGIDSTSADYFIYKKAYLDENPITIVGQTKEPNVELIASLQPDVILAWAGYGAELADEIQEKTKIPVISLHTLTTIEGMEAGYSIVAKLIGKEDRAKELFDYANKKMDEIKKVTSTIPENEKPKIHLLFWGFWNGVSRIPVYYDPVNIAGGINIAKGSDATVYGYSIKVPIEQVVVWNPDVILIHGSPKNPMVEKETVTSDVRVKYVSAIKTNRVYYTLGMNSGWHYTRVLTELMYMAKRFHPDKFKDLDLIKEGNEIYEKFYGVKNLWSDYGKEEGYIE